MYDLDSIYETVPILNGYNYEDYFFYMESYIEYLSGLDHIQSPEASDDEEWQQLEHHLRFVIKQTINREHRDLLKLGDSVYVIWSKLKMAEANCNRILTAQTLSHQILILRQSILKKIGYENARIESRKRKLESEDDDEAKTIKKAAKRETSS